MIAAAHTYEELERIAAEVATEGHRVAQWLVRDGESIGELYAPRGRFTASPCLGDQFLDDGVLNHGGVPFVRASFVPKGEAWPVTVERFGAAWLAGRRRA